MSVLNIQFIQKRLKEAHANFIKTVGGLPNKVTADHQLIVARMTTRIEAILYCFKEEGIIDNIAKKEIRNEGDCSCAIIEIWKNGFDKSVVICTDGININIRTANYPLSSGLDIEDGIMIKDICFDSYNWVDFSDRLLSFVHKVIYERAKVLEAKIFKMD